MLNARPELANELGGLYLGSSAAEAATELVQRLQAPPALHLDAERREP